jgi:hypothetical protein
VLAGKRAHNVTNPTTTTTITHTHSHIHIHILQVSSTLSLLSRTRTRFISFSIHVLITQHMLRYSHLHAVLTGTRSHLY